MPNVIFSPGQLAIDLAEGLRKEGIDVTLFTPGPVDTKVDNVTADLRYFDAELASREDTYIDLLKKHPLTFISLARQVQSEIIANAFKKANNDGLDVIHIYTNEEDVALPFTRFCKKPVVFTHHDPFNFSVKYKSVFPKYKTLNWLSMSYAQRSGMPADTNWLANIYHGLDGDAFTPAQDPQNDYIAYLGRIIQPKGVHLAIEAVKSFNHGRQNSQKLKLKIAGRHYAGSSKDTYWQNRIKDEIGHNGIEYLGHIKNTSEKRDFIANAKALIIPSTFEEPFGMVTIEALACGTPVIGIRSGAISEIITPGINGLLVEKATTIAIKNGKKHEVIDEDVTSESLAAAINEIALIDRKHCRQDFESRFTLKRMCQEHSWVYERLVTV